MIKKITILLVTILAVTATFGNFRFNFNKAHIDTDGYRDAIVIPCEGGSQDYEYEFKNLPRGWYAQGNRIYAPRSSYTEGKFYGIKVGVYDRVYRQFLRRSFIFAIKSSNIFDYIDTDYEVDISGEDKIEQLIKEKRNRNQRKNHYYVQFPDLTEVQQYIDRGDVIYLRKVIDDVISSGRECQVVADYLNQFLSIVQLRLTFLRNTVQAGKQDIFIIQQELTFLQKQLKERQQQNIDIDQLKRKIEHLRSKISVLVEENQSTQTRLSNTLQSIKISEQQIFDIKINIVPGARDQVEESQQQINIIDIELENLRKRISILELERSRYVQEKQQALRILEDAERRITILNGIISSSQADVRKFQTRIRNNLLSIRNFEKRIIDIQEQIDQGSDNGGAIRELEIRIRTITIQIEEKTSAIRNIERIIQSLQVKVKIYQKTISKHYYSCYNFSDDNEQQEVEAPQTAFTSYLKQVFGYTSSQNIRARFSGSQIKLKHLSIFSPSWIKVFGIPYSAGYGNNMDIMETQFSCETFGQQELEVFDGKILNVNRNTLDVRIKNGDQYTVHLGGCTRIQLANQHQIPEVGDNIFFKGKFRKHGGRREYNGYHLTCY